MRSYCIRRSQFISKNGNLSLIYGSIKNKIKARIILPLVQGRSSMPIYEFKCTECGNIFEFLCFRSDEEDKTTCPSCGGKKTEKLLSTFSSGSSGSGKGLGSLAASSSCSPTGGFS